MQIEFHILQSFPPANLNRDENGMPKSCVFGGRSRARISSQCQKRAVRRYYHDYQELGIDPIHFAARSRGWRSKLKELLVEQGVIEAHAEVAANLAITVLTEKEKKKEGKKGKGKEEDNFNEDEKETKTKSDTILFLGKTEIAAIARTLINNWDQVESGLASKQPALPPLINKGIVNVVKPPKKGEAGAYGKPGDVALFGRMMAVLPAGNVDASVQVAHAIGVNVLQQEFDFFTAVDELGANDGQGSAHMGETGYNSSTYYRFANLDTEQLKENLGADEQAPVVATAFAKAFVKAIPSGHQNSFAAHSLPALVLIVVRSGQPVSLVDAFENPVRPSGGMSLLSIAVQELDRHWTEMVKMYGDRDVQYVGIVTKSRLAECLTTLKEKQVESVDDVVSKAVAVAFSTQSNVVGVA